MVSQGSDCNSDGVPGYMQDSSVDVLEEVRLRREVEDFPIPVAGGIEGSVNSIPAKQEAKPGLEDVYPAIEGFPSPRSALRWVEEEENRRKGSCKVSTSGTVPSSLVGGIPIESVLVEDSVSSDEETGQETDMEALERLTLSRATKAAFAVNKVEREELLAARAQIQKLKEIIRNNGLSLVQEEISLAQNSKAFNGNSLYSNLFMEDRDEFGLPKVACGGTNVKSHNSDIIGAMGAGSLPPKFIDGRDEFGLPIFTNKAHEARSGMDKKIVDKVLEDLPNLGEASGVGPSGQHNRGEVPMEKETLVPPKRSWKQVVDSSPKPDVEVKFEYVPLPAGVSTVTPPDEVLQQGVDKLKYCIVGEFTKATLSFNTVKDLALKLWGDKGLLQVFQKSASTFLFKFVDIASKTAVLARGTIFLYNRPLVLRDWSSSAGAKPVTSLPLWVKLFNLPDCYWTIEGLSRVASVIGNPICADKLTQKLEILPFARMCVDYKIGDPLPNVIPVTALNPSGEKYVDEVHVEYVHKPLICSGCKQLGHPVTACPVTKRIWVQKSVQKPQAVQTEEVIEKTDLANQLSGTSAETPVTAETGTVTAGVPSNVVEIPVAEGELEHGDEGDWKEVIRKRRLSAGKQPADIALSPASASPAMPENFRNIVVDEIAKKQVAMLGSAKKLSKSQRKRQKSLGRGGTPSHR